MAKIKSYSPIRVKNPTSLQHVVRVQPGQSIIVRLDLTAYPEPRVTTTSPYLAVLSDAISDGWYQAEIAHPDWVKSWAHYSGAFLGDVWIESKNIGARLEVMLECCTVGKGRMVTVVNPDCVDVRFRPHNIIEIICFDQRFGDQDEWEWYFNPLFDVGVEQIGYNRLSLNAWRQFYEFEGGDAPEHAYARLPRTESAENPWCRQHHFWFRFDHKMYQFIRSVDGVKHIGDFTLRGFPDLWKKHLDQPQTHHLAVHVDTRGAQVNQLSLTLGIPTLHSIGSPPPAPGPWAQKPLGLPVAKPRIREKRVPLVRDVQVSVKWANDLYSGCRTIPAEPPEPSEQQCPDPDDCCDPTLGTMWGPRPYDMPPFHRGYHSRYGHRDDWWD